MVFPKDASQFRDDLTYCFSLLIPCNAANLAGSTFLRALNPIEETDHELSSRRRDLPGHG